MRAHLIVNPRASSVTSRGHVLIQRALGARHELTVHETARRNHATRLARSAADEGAEVVIVLGGDGTLNEAANGLIGTGVPLGVLPGGSTNVFARTVGFTNDPVEATSELLDALASSHKKTMSLGKANNRYFLFHAGIGFDAAVVEQVEHAGRLKRYAGHPLFVWSTLMTLARRGERRSPRFSVQFPTPRNNVESVNGYLTICLNSDPYTFLGNRPFNVAPNADYAKGMAVFTVKSLRFPAFSRIATNALFSGKRIKSHPKADLRTEVGSCEVTGFGKFPYQLDGDYLGDVETLTLTHVPDALEVYLPRN